MLERTDHQLCMPELMAAKLAATAPNGGSLRGCHRLRLRSAISVCPLLRLWGSSASRLGGWATKAGKGRPPRATGARIHNPRRTSSHVRKAPGSALNPAAIMTCPAGCGRSSRRPAGPVALPRRDAHRGQRAAGYAAHRQAPGYHRGYDEILARRRLPPLTAAGLSLCDESFACYLLREAAW